MTPAFAPSPTWLGLALLFTASVVAAATVRNEVRLESRVAAGSGAAGGSTLVLDGVRYRLPAEARREGAGTGFRLVVTYHCINETGRVLPQFEPPRFTLKDPAGREFPADPEASRDQVRQAGLDQRRRRALEPGGRFESAEIFPLPAGIPGGVWQLRLDAPGRVIAVSLRVPP